MNEPASSRGYSGLHTHLPGILQSLIATAIGGGLLPCVNTAWESLFHHPLWVFAQGPLAYAIAALILIPVSWLLTGLGRRRLLGKTPGARGDRLAIYVAHFGPGELSAMARDRVIASIRSEFGANRVEILPAGIELVLTPGVSDDVASLAPRARAQQLLKKKKGDLLIWGRLLTLPEMKPRIELHFVAAQSERFRAQPFGFTDKMMLDQDFGPEMGAALAAAAAASATSALADRGRYLAQTLIPLAARLQPLLHNLPASICADDRACLFASYGHIQSVIGEQSGQSQPLQEGIAAFREALKEWTCERMPREWARMQNNLGNALATLGERESGTEKLEQAIVAYRNALKESTREPEPLKWAMTQNNLGNALAMLAERESGTEKFELAVEAYREALKERTRERVPLDWALTQNNLGSALNSWGQRESGTEKLEQAIEAYRNALKESTRQRVPLDWALAQDNLGNALSTLGEREHRTEKLIESLDNYRNALKERTRQRVPLDWACTQYNLGIALYLLGSQETGTEKLDLALDAYREALKECTRERAPFDWAMTLSNLGITLYALGQRETGTEKLHKAIEAYGMALQELTAERSPHYHQIVQENLKQAIDLLEKRRHPAQ